MQVAVAVGLGVAVGVGASGIAVGANEPIANQTSRFDCDSSTQIIDIRGLSDPGTIGKVGAVSSKAAGN